MISIFRSIWRLAVGHTVHVETMLDGVLLYVVNVIWSNDV